MPEINFVLPHWLYWSGLIVFPLIAMWLFRKRAGQVPTRPVSLPLGYFLLFTGGFIGMHRLYLKSVWSVVFIALFVGILFINQEVRDMRVALSEVTNQIMIAEFEQERANQAIRDGNPAGPQQLEAAAQKLAEARDELQLAKTVSEEWTRLEQIMAGVILLLLVIDAGLLPRLVQQRNARETLPGEPAFHCPAVEAEHDDSTEPLAFNRTISHLNGLAGEFVAYWSVIAVVVYYYEVIVRYVFNSPTNWAHEGMFLMFGMQYLLAGGYVLREGAHVRVDVIYQYFSNRAKAIVDLFTSIFFFIFVVTLLITGWTFFYDAYRVNEVSFTEWGIHYWPIKFALPLGAALLLLQGISQLIKDIAVVINPDAIKLDTSIRPEG